ncbi:PREDICTED: C3a anaphylatoxin chemotactic receptor-like [Thamnophis sirtalis]|uniref:C3a anaphylatoxin chemotactic receptor-like n=1 Tax=Thamnophis sirtalis TaxID=35019 RepID=A0A6I9Y709_9SAUR|nr:PREDICTED: C3a anaphylatoxin chemotactic receptor-like [Thamnophis sirtalis]XP_032084507.1 C3a anaphylatoxin chemotactic receptor-like [Thamnophis elegans]
MNSSLTALWLPNASWPSSLETVSDVNRFQVLSSSLKFVFYMFIFLLGSLGNGIVIWITCRQVSRTISCVWFFNLALADFLFSMSRIAPLVAVKKGWIFGSFACKANGLIKYLNMFCSEFLLAAISMDRAACIAYPLWARRHRNIRLVWLAAVVAWIMAIIISIPFYLYRKVDTKNNRTECRVMLKGEEPEVQVTIYMLRLICGFLIPFTIIVVCYGIIIMVLRRRQTSLHSKKSFKVILALVVTFSLCWLPYHITQLLTLPEVKGPTFLFIKLAAAFLAYLNSCANPFLYFFMGVDLHTKLTLYSIIMALRRTLLDESSS